jgi:hypothetical protein
MSGDRQHFVPQAYLKRFTNTGRKNGTLSVYDFLRDREFSCKPAQVAHMNAYYRLQDGLYDNVDPDCVDETLDRTIPAFDKLIEEIIQSKRISTPVELKNSLEMHVAFLMARHPESRKSLQSMFDVAIKEHALTQMHTAPESLQKVVEEVGIHDGLKVEFNDDYFKANIFEAAASYCASLQERTWQLVECAEGTSFATSDRPVCLMNLKNGANTRLIDLCSTVILSLSKRFAVLGVYDARQGFAQLTVRQTGLLNSRIIERARSQVYFDDKFVWLNKKSQIASKKQFISWMREPSTRTELDKTRSEAADLRRSKNIEVFRENFDPLTFERKNPNDPSGEP